MKVLPTRSLVVAALAVLVPLTPSGASASERRTGEVLVRQVGRGAADPGLLDRLVAHPGVSGLRPLEGRWPAFAVRVSTGFDPDALARDLARDPMVSWAYADRIFQVVARGEELDDPLASNQWHLHNDGANPGALPGADVGADRAWALAEPGTGIRIAVLDSGVDLTHPDLNLDVGAGWDAVDNDADPSPDPDDGGAAHGTCVAGLAAAIGDNGLGVRGVAHGATVLPYRMIGGVTASGMRATFVRAVDAGADVINNSWGFQSAGCPAQPSLPPLLDGIDYAEVEGRGGLGTLVLFATGNDGCRQVEDPLLAHPPVIGVGASNDRDEKWFYSTWGPNVDVVAPSGSLGGRERPDLWTTDLVGDSGWNGAGAQNEYTPWFGGTSGATPVASGVVALMLAANPRIDAATVREALCATAERVDPAVAAYDDRGWSDLYGCGRVDAAAAVAAVRNGAPGAPTDLVLMADAANPLGALLRWEPAADPDADWLRYRVEWWLTDEDDREEREVDRPYLDIDGPLLEGTWHVRVTAIDPWGPAPASLETTFDVQAPEVVEEDVAACSAAPGSGALGFLSLPLLFALRRRARVIRAHGAPPTVLISVSGSVALALLAGCASETPAEPTPPPPPLLCGDGLPVGSEECDDANAWGGDGCAPDCTIERRPGESEPNDDPSSSGGLDSSGGVLGALPAGDRDCFRVLVADGGWVAATVTAAGQVAPPQTRIELVDPTGALVATSSPSADGLPTLDPLFVPGARFLAAGSFALCVTPLPAHEVRGYLLTVEAGSDSCGLGAPVPSDLDADADTLEDRCDPDDDGDAVPDVEDLCPHVPDGGSPLPLSPDHEGFLRDWLLSGPFQGAATTEGCRPSEDLHLGDDPQHTPSLAGAAGASSWYLHRSPGARIDALLTQGGDVPRELYAALYVRSATARPLTLALGPDDGARAYMDEAVLLDVAGCQGTNVDQFQAPWTADTDWHRLLLKVRDQGGAWGFYARFLDEAGVPVTDLEISLASGGPWAPGQVDTDDDGLGDTCDPSPAP